MNRHRSSYGALVGGGASSFHGREADLGMLRRLLENHRLVTILGPGGMGKTRLALHHVEAVRETYREAGGVWVIGLASVATEGELLAAVAHALDVSVGVEGTALGVASHLERLGPALMVLDNLEQLIPVCVPVLTTWLDIAPSLRILTTSRAALGVAGEHVLDLAPLTVAASSELFVTRAKAIDPQLDPDPTRVAAIVAAVDRMPLAIELAASRMRVLSLGELQGRLERPLEVLVGRPTGGRHDSVRQAVLDSLELLSVVNRRVFALLSALQNGFTTEDVEAVLGDRVLPRHDVLDALEALVRTSLMQTDRAADPARHGFFQTVREVARELAVDDPLRPAVLEAHAAYYASRARACIDLEGEAPSSEASGEPVVQGGDADNMLAAHAWCLGAEDVAPVGGARDLALALEGPMTARGQLQRRRELLASTLAACDHRDVRLLLAHGRAVRDAGETAAAAAILEEALASVAGGTDPILAAEIMVALGGIDDVLGATARARQRHGEALRLVAAHPSRAAMRARVRARLALAHAYRREGELAEGTHMASAAAVEADALGDSLGVATAHYELAALAMFGKRHAEADAHLVQGLEVAREHGLPVMEGAMNTARGCLHQLRGNSTEARTCHAEAARVFGNCGSRHREGSALYYLATTYLEVGRPKDAIPILERAGRRLAPIGAPRYEALVAAALALAYRAEGAAIAEGLMERAEASSARVCNEPALDTSIALQRWAFEAVDSEDAGSSSRRLEEARRRVAQHETDDTHFALRMLVRATAATREVDDDADALVVRGDGRAFRPPGTTSIVALRPESPNQLIFAALVAKRMTEPGARVSLEEIIAVGWPNEKIVAEAALNRAYVAIATLRKKGLRGILEKVAGGYALSPGMPIRTEDL